MVFLEKMPGERYGINFIFFDAKEVKLLHNIYEKRVDRIAEEVIKHFEKSKEEYLAMPYMNKKLPYELIVWMHSNKVLYAFTNKVFEILREKCFKDIAEVDRPFSVFGYVENGKSYGCGCDGISAESICGYKKVFFENIYISAIQIHFHCGHNISTDKKLLLALKAIEGINVNDIPEKDKEEAAKAIECGYIYREGDMLYTKIPVLDITDMENEAEIFKLNNKFVEETVCIAEEIAKETEEVLKKLIPDYLLNEYRFANLVASLPIIDGVCNALIEKGYLTAPENGIGAEGCFAFIDR